MKSIDKTRVNSIRIKNKTDVRLEFMKNIF